MAHDERALMKLGRRVGDTLGEGPDEERREAQRRAVMGALQTGPARGRPRRAVITALAGVSAVAAAAVVVFLAMRPTASPPRSAPATIAFQVEGRGPGQVGHWLEAQGGTLVLRFVGGTRMALEREGRAQVVQSDEQQVAVRLDHGRLRADVQRRGDTSWNVVAGPYRVTVLGTKFGVRWNAAVGTLRVGVTRGRVRVTGQGLADGGVVLGAREELRVDRRTNRWTVARAPIASRRPPRPTQTRVASPTVATAPKPDGRPVPRVAPRPTLARPVPAWKSLLRKGRLADAVAAAERAGIPRLAATLPAGDLWRLATAGRGARRGATAETLLKAYRRRFSGSSNARTAAFLLGRISMELRGQPGAAATWFRRYLRDAPTGPLAEEALGRYVGACRRAGRTTEARAAARRYLKRYPTGIYRNLARSVLGE